MRGEGAGVRGRPRHCSLWGFLRRDTVPDTDHSPPHYDDLHLTRIAIDDFNASHDGIEHQHDLGHDRGERVIGPRREIGRTAEGSGQGEKGGDGGGSKYILRKHAMGRREAAAAWEASG